MKTIKHFKDSIYDQWLYLYSDTDYPVYNRYTRYNYIPDEIVPNEVNKLIKHISLKRKDRKCFTNDMLVLGIYPDIIFIPIKITLKERNNIFNNYYFTYNDYELVNYDEYNKFKGFFNSKDPYKEMKNSGLFPESMVILPWKLDTRSINRYDIYYNNLFYPRALEEVGGFIYDHYNYYHIMNTKLFKYMGCPIFITDLTFCDCVCNPNLSQIKLNLKYFENSLKSERCDFVDYKIPNDLIQKISKDIPSRIEDFLTSSNEDLTNVKPLTDIQKRDLYGFNKDSFRGPNKII